MELQNSDDIFFEFMSNPQPSREIEIAEDESETQCFSFLNGSDASFDILNNYPAIKDIFLKYNTGLFKSRFFFY